jgi:hypothetical protein
MKRLMLLTLCIPAFLLFSFTLRQERGVKRVSTHLYAVTPVAAKRVTAAEQEEIKKVVADHYGIKDFGRGKILIARDDPRNKVAGGILDNSIYKDWVSTKLFFWKNIKDLPQEVIKANVILSKYAAGQ